MNEQQIPAQRDQTFIEQIKRFALERPADFVEILDNLLSTTNADDVAKLQIASYLSHRSTHLPQQNLLSTNAYQQRKLAVVKDSNSSTEISPPISTKVSAIKDERPDIVLFHPTTTVTKAPVSPDEAVHPSSSADEADGASMGSSIWLHSPEQADQHLQRRRSSSRSGSISMTVAAAAAAATMNTAIANQINNTDADEWIRHKWLQHNRNELSDHAHASNDPTLHDVEENKRRTFENHKQRLRQLRMSKDVLTEDSLLRELIIDVAKELDVDMLCCKVLQNVLALINGDRGSLFLATSNAPGGGGPALVSQLFDITLDTKWADVSSHKKGTVVLPFGKGIAGRVAQTLKPISINDAYADTRFDKTVDKATGYHTRCLLCYPIISADNQLIGVAQIINKQSPTETFTKADEAVFAQYLVFCGIGLQNAQLFEVSLQEYRRNQLLLSLARSIFRQQLSIELMVRQIMQQCRTLVPCDCCWIMLLDTVSTSAMQQEYAQFEQKRRKSLGTGSVWSLKQQFDNVDGAATKKTQYQTLTDIQFSEAFALPDDNNDTGAEAAIVLPSDLDGSWILELSRAVVFSRRPIRMEKDVVENQSKTLAHHVGLVVAEDVDSRTHLSTDVNLKATHSFRNKSTFAKSFSIATSSGPAVSGGNSNGDENGDEEENDEKNYLAMPVFNAQQHVVATIIMEGRHGLDEFGSNDMQMMEAFAIFCGLGITNAQLYEKALHWCARQQVALEVISYHAMAPQAEVELLLAAPIQPANKWGLHSYKFNDAVMHDEQLTLQACMAMFADLNLISQFNVDYETLCRWVCSVRKNYRPVKYHNWRHAFNVAQTMYAMLVVGELEAYFDPLTVFGLIVAALCHDLDHRGTNNAFQSLAGTGLAVLYGTSVMEHHHFNQCMLLLSNPNNNIFSSLSTSQYKRLVSILERCILATDLAIFFKKKGEFNKMAEEYQKKYKIIEDQTTRQQQQQQADHNSSGTTSAVKRMRKFLRSSSSISTSSSVMNRGGSSSLMRSNQPGTTVVTGGAVEQQQAPSFLYWRDSATANTLLATMLMTACDVSAIAKPWPIQRNIARVVYDEFFDQGDLEKQAFGKISSDMLDRGKRADLPNMQVKFIDSVCEPLYKTLAAMFPGVAALCEGCKENRAHWLHETALHAADSGGNNGITAGANIHQLPSSIIIDEASDTAEEPLPGTKRYSFAATVSTCDSMSPARTEQLYLPTEASRASVDMEQEYTLHAEYRLPRRSVSAHVISDSIDNDGAHLRPTENNGSHRSAIELASRRRVSSTIILSEQRNSSTVLGKNNKDEEYSESNSETTKSRICAAASAGSCVCTIQ